MTAAELIAALSAFPADALVVIEDVDTNYALHAYVSAGYGTWAGTVVLGGNYENMWEPPAPPPER